MNLNRNIIETLNKNKSLEKAYWHIFSALKLNLKEQNEWIQ